MRVDIISPTYKPDDTFCLLLQKLQEQIEKKVRKGYSAEDIAEMLETDIETVQKLQKNKI